MRRKPASSCHIPDSLISATPGDHANVLPNGVGFDTTRVAWVPFSKEKRVKTIITHSRESDRQGLVASDRSVPSQNARKFVSVRYQFSQVPPISAPKSVTCYLSIVQALMLVPGRPQPAVLPYVKNVDRRS